MRHSIRSKGDRLSGVHTPRTAACKHSGGRTLSSGRAASHICILIAGLTIFSPCLLADQAAAACKREDFEEIVEQATTAPRTSASQNRPGFQEQLRLLREKRGWSHEEFVTAAAPFVRDDNIITLDQKSARLLADINRLGEGASRVASEPDCSLLAPLRTSLDGMVAAQTEKWRYMFAKIDAELTN